MTRSASVSGGVDDAGPAGTGASAVLTAGALREWPLPSTDGGKESRGRLLVVGGSRTTPGGVLLAAEAAMRSGAGKLQIATVASVAVGLGLAIPEAMVVGLPEDEDGDLDPAAGGRIVELASGCQGQPVTAARPFGGFARTRRVEPAGCRVPDRASGRRTSATNREMPMSAHPAPPGSLGLADRSAATARPADIRLPGVILGSATVALLTA